MILNKSRNRSFFATVMCLLCACVTLAQIPSLRNFTPLEYGAGTQNWAVDCMENGSMLYANNNGLLLFDGIHWDVYQVPNYTNVRSVLYERNMHRIYTGATDEFGFFYSKSSTEPPAYLSLSAKLPKQFQQFGEIWKILQCGDEFVFQAKNVVFITNGNDKIKIFPFRFRIENASIVGKNRLIVSTREAIYEYHNGTFYVMKSLEPLLGKSVMSVLEHDGKLLFITANDGIYKFDNHTCTPYDIDINEQLKRSIVFSADATEDYLAFGTVKDGLIIKDLKKNVNYYVNSFTGLINNTVLSLKFDQLGNIWLGLDNGIAYVILSTPSHDLLGSNNSIGTGYASTIYHNRLYLGTNQGLYVTDYPLNNVISPSKPQEVRGISGQIWSLKQIEDDLFCCGDKGAFVIRDDVATPINGLSGTWGVIPLKRHNNTLVAYDYNGFAVIENDGGGYRVIHRIQGVDISSGAVIEDADGSVWVSHWRKGVYRFEFSDDLMKVTDVKVFKKGNGLVIDDNNLICLIDGRVRVSSVNGFFIYDRKTGRLIQDSLLTSVFNTFGESLRLEQTPQGDIWAYKPGYMTIARKQTNNAYSVDTFAYANVYNRLQMSLGHNNFLGNEQTLMNYDNGFFVIDNNFTSVKVSHQVNICNIYSTNLSDSLLYNQYPGEQLKKLKIPHNLNSLRIEFVMPEYRDNNAVTYTYYLKNYDKDWNASTTTTSKEYTQLSKGDYEFCVKAYNLLNGTTSEARLKIEILPAWYETWWAYLIYTLLILTALFYFFRYMNFRIKRELKRVRLEKERQLREQKARFLLEEEQQEKELIQLRNNQLEVELKHKSSELAGSTMNLVRKNDMLHELDEQMEELSATIAQEKGKAAVNKKIRDIRRGIKTNIEEDDNWEKFEENFNVVYDNFMKKITQEFPNLKQNDKKLCAYLRMGLSSKEMASLLNTSLRSIETARYRLRKKLNLNHGENLTDFIQHYD